MTAWRPQLYERQGRDAGVDPTVLAHALDTAEQLWKVSPGLPPVFTLAHLAHQAGVDYASLRCIAERSSHEAYRVFRIRKRSAYPNERRYRHIAVPSASLMKAQRWITQAILSKATPHPSSVAFSKGDTLVAATGPHCGCRWLIKMDVRNFFARIRRMTHEFLVRTRQLVHNFQDLVLNWSRRLWRTRRVNQTARLSGSNSTGD